MEGESIAICGTYITFAQALESWTKINVVYDITISMTTFSLLARIRYLPTFFGPLKIEFVPTLQNMVNKVAWFNVNNAANNIPQATCSHANREPAFQFYNVGTRHYYVQAAANDPRTTWIMFTPSVYEIKNTYFYSSSFKLIRDRYTSLVS
ncbi:MAG: hypothetical protein Ta2E_01230 [Mycoplasmoidaceae bacterium]|nr:MAG: hypothetical protein Ta2E_01230 [Mycoplasmoidaceae bacterium]